MEANLRFNGRETMMASRIFGRLTRLAELDFPAPECGWRTTVH